MTDSSSKTTTNHEDIKMWAKKRGAVPAIVKGTEEGDSALLRLNFPGYAEDNLEEISWDDFFEIFEENNLSFLYQEEKANGEMSNFFKFVNRD